MSYPKGECRVPQGAYATFDDGMRHIIVNSDTDDPTLLDAMCGFSGREVATPVQRRCPGCVEVWHEVSAILRGESVPARPAAPESGVSNV